jgi:Zn-dependent metalloprotease
MKRKSGIVKCFFVIASSIIFISQILNTTAFGQVQTIVEKDGSVLLPSQKIKSNATDYITTATMKSSAWKEFYKQNGNWTVMMDKATLTPTRAFGKPVQIENYSEITNDNIEAAAMQFLRNYSNVLNINPDNLKFLSSNHIGKLWYVNYSQVHNGIDVLLSNVTLRITDAGKVMAFGVKYYNDINISLTPDVPYSKAMSNAAYGLNYNIKSDVILNTGKTYILPVKFKGKVSYSLVYEFHIETKEPAGKYLSYVDAHSGNVVWRINGILDADTKISIKGAIRPKYSYDVINYALFPYQYFTVGSNQYQTDSTGTYTLNLPSKAQITAMLEGPFAKVVWVQSSNTEASYKDSVTPVPNYLMEWNDGNSDAKERNLFYHTNVVHSYLKNLDPDFKGMDYQIQIGIEPGGQAPNAGWDGLGITFYSTDLTDYKFAETPSILYHEYTHGINAKLYYQVLHGDSLYGMVNAACNEGTADVMSCFMIDDSMVGRGAFVANNNEYIRILTNDNIYPDSVDGESHHDGQILSGAYWDLRKMTSVPVAETIYHYAKYGTPDDPDDGIAFSEWFWESLISDDNKMGDNDLSNGTPHINEIVTAFNNHHIGTDLLMEMSFKHTPLEDTQDTLNPYIVNFELKSTPNILGSHPDSVYVIYSTDNFKTLNFVPAVKVYPNPDSTLYRAEIPAMKKGTIVSYYMRALESASHRTINFAGNDYTKFTPYKFLVGFETLYLENFEDEAVWTAGSDSDNATTGIWEWAQPNKEEITFQGSTYTLQPGQGHTTGGLKCWVTGPLVDPDSNKIFSNMPNGRTTLLSKIYDLSKINLPAIRFYKWFTDILTITIPGYDTRSTLAFDVSNDSGLTWVNIDTSFESTFGWAKSLYALDDYITSTDKVQFRFSAHSYQLFQGYLAALTEALVDDFEILYSSYITHDTVNVNDYIKESSVICYPNPFNTSTTILYELGNPSHVNLRIFDLLGNEITTLVDEYQDGGRRTAIWNCSDFNGNKVNAGLYIYQLRAGYQLFTGKLIVE